MLDPIALLQSLTLPAGATTGQRIVIDGVAGTIQGYDASNNLVWEISSAGFVFYDPGHIVRSAQTPAGFEFRDAAGVQLMTVDGTVGLSVLAGYSILLSNPGVTGKILIDSEQQRYHKGSFTATTDVNGFITGISHGAGFTPSVIKLIKRGTGAGANVFWSGGTDTITATTFRARCLDNTGSAVNTTSVTVDYICYP